MQEIGRRNCNLHLLKLSNTLLETSVPVDQYFQLRAESFATGEEFLGTKHAHRPSCLVLDVRLPRMSGLDFQRKLAARNVCIPIVFITGHGDIPMSVRAMKAGAVEFLTKPFRDQDLLDAINIGLERDRARREQEKLLADIIR